MTISAANFLEVFGHPPHIFALARCLVFLSLSEWSGCASTVVFNFQQVNFCRERELDSGARLRQGTEEIQKSLRIASVNEN